MYMYLYIYMYILLKMVSLIVSLCDHRMKSAPILMFRVSPGPSGPHTSAKGFLQTALLHNRSSCAVFIKLVSREAIIIII